jgi:catechol 2,3-dioxygenase-like lactoylglutathione lyase family enzyme
VRPHVAIISLAVRDFDRAKRFYSEGLGWPIQQEQGEWACFSLGDGSSALTLYPWEETAAEAGVSAHGDGFRGVVLAYNGRSVERVDEVMAEAEPPVARPPSLRSGRPGAATAATSPTPRATSGKWQQAPPSCPSPNSTRRPELRVRSARLGDRFPDSCCAVAE